jgi:hypothetical protein
MSHHAPRHEDQREPSIGEILCSRPWADLMTTLAPIFERHPEFTRDFDVRIGGLVRRNTSDAMHTPRTEATSCPCSP